MSIKYKKIFKNTKKPTKKSKSSPKRTKKVKKLLKNNKEVDHGGRKTRKCDKNTITDTKCRQKATSNLGQPLTTVEVIRRLPVFEHYLLSIVHC